MSHLNHGRIPAEYTTYIGRKVYFLAGLGFLAVVLFILAISLGAVRVPMQAVLRTLCGMETDARFQIIIHNIRLRHTIHP